MDTRNQLDMISEESMNGFPVLFALIISIVFILCLGCGKKQVINKIDVYSINWDIMTRYDVSDRDILNGVDFDNVKKYAINNKERLRLIFGRIQNLKPLIGYNSIDVRMVCIIYFSDGKKEEICFGNTKIAFYKKTIFDEDRELINLIENSCSK